VALSELLSRRADWWGKNTNQRILAKWDKFLPAVLRGHIRPYRWQRTTLLVEAENSAWAQELQLRKPEIIAGINTAAEKEILKELVVRVKGRPFTSNRDPGRVPDR